MILNQYGKRWFATVMGVRQARERGRKEQSIAEHPLWTQCLKLHILSQEPEKERNLQNRFPAVCNRGPALGPRLSSHPQGAPQLKRRKSQVCLGSHGSHSNRRPLRTAPEKLQLDIRQHFIQTYEKKKLGKKRNLSM